jgi:SAM-dependent methyltransferase
VKCRRVCSRNPFLVVAEAKIASPPPLGSTGSGPSGGRFSHLGSGSVARLVWGRDEAHSLLMGYRYDRIGIVYGLHRRGDPRIMRQIERALGEADSVVDVGAGTGAYSPVERQVVAVEPSEVMIAQRPEGAAPVVRALADVLPFPDISFDAALATFTVHHWSDPAAGLREMRRVSTSQVVHTFEQGEEWLDEFWLTRDYLPREYFHGSMFSGLEPVLRELDSPEVEVVPIPADCSDGFFCAYWKRPQAYLDPDVRISISALALLDDEVLEPGLHRLADDLRSGRWAERNRDLIDLDTYDWGYRLVVSTA